jgi:hypothetical protein
LQREQAFASRSVAEEKADSFIWDDIVNDPFARRGDIPSQLDGLITRLNFGASSDAASRSNSSALTRGGMAAWAFTAQALPAADGKAHEDLQRCDR